MSRAVVLLLVLAGCNRTTAAPVTAPVVDPVAAAPVADPAAGAGSGSTDERAPVRDSTARFATEPFGGERWGFVTASSKGGSLVFVRIFDGKPSFGHHGSASVPSALHIFEGASGRERTVDELIDLDASRRYALVLDNKQLWLVDTERDLWEPLDDADMRADDNSCLAPRQATFSGQGTRVAWVNKGADALIVRDLESRDRWTIPANGRLWRGWSDDGGRGAVLLEVSTGQRGSWPRQNTSCACRWCNRFAMSYGVYGWSGPDFTIEHVAEDDTRSPGEPPSGGSPWHGPNEAGCTLEPASKEGSLEKGPWAWVCTEALALALEPADTPTPSTRAGVRPSTELALLDPGPQDRG